MFVNLLIGTLMMVINLGIQVMAITILTRHFVRQSGQLDSRRSTSNDIWVLSIAMTVLIVGHVFQFATWAILFFSLGEFTNFADAFYHSTVNFTSLGYGDIVMSEKHRLLGALEAANGVLMFGLSAGLILAVLNIVFSRYEAVVGLRERITNKK